MDPQCQNLPSKHAVFFRELRWRNIFTILSGKLGGPLFHSRCTIVAAPLPGVSWA